MNLRELVPGMVYRALCLHGFAPDTQGDWWEVYELMTELFSHVDLSPQRICLDDVPGFTEDSVPIKKWLDWTEQHGLPIPSAMELSAAYGGVLGWVTPRLHTRATCSVGGLPFGGDLVFMVDAALKRMEWSVCDGMARSAWLRRHFEYGYALSHPEPITFVNGVVRRGLSKSDSCIRRLWQDFRSNTPQGHAYVEWLRKQAGVGAQLYEEVVSYTERLRDVFPRNYLVESHLALAVGDRSLSDWINEDASRGSLIQLTDGLWCWVVDERSIEPVRHVLELAGLLVAARGM